MPYITQDAKRALDNQVKRASNAGELTYQLTMALQQYLQGRVENTGRLRYAALAECLGALEGAKLDLIERIITPYEQGPNGPRQTNGDVWSEDLLP